MFGFLRRKPHIKDNLMVGKPDVRPDKPSHVRGVREGNDNKGKLEEEGIYPTGPVTARGSARRSTGIRPAAHGPIDPRMPNLSPA